jgi:simple sugar transport system permease protein
MGLLMVFMSATLRSDQTLTGITIGILSMGLVAFLLRPIFGGTWIPTPISFEAVHIPVLSEIPVLGPALFQHNFLTYLGILLVPILAFVLFRTDLGLKIRAVGENPQAADTLGVNVYLIRYLSVIFTGAMAGFAGAYISLAYVKVFSEGIIASRGWIALALVTFGRRSPYKILGGALLFGFVDALQIRLQGIPDFPIPYEFLLMLPYILSIAILVITVRAGGEQEAPKALGIPYKRE